MQLSKYKTIMSQNCAKMLCEAQRVPNIFCDRRVI